MAKRLVSQKYNNIQYIYMTLEKSTFFYVSPAKTGLLKYI